MKLLTIILLLSALLPSGVTLDAGMTEYGLTFTVRSDTARHVYVQLDPADGATVQDPIIYEFDLGAGDAFGRTVQVHGPGSVNVRVWVSDGGEAPATEARVSLPAHRTYLPLLYGAAVN